MKTINLLRIAIFILIGSCSFAFIGLLSENKVSNFYDQIDNIKTEKKLIKMWQLGFNVTYADAISSKIMDEDFYLIEQNNVREINRCVRNWQIAKRAKILEWAIPDYSKFQVQKFYDPIIFDKVKVTHDTFLKWEKINSNLKPCSLEKNRVFIKKTTATLFEFYPFYLSNLNKILNVLKEKEVFLYKSIDQQSSQAANLYLITFIILLLSTTIIVIVDIKTNRGGNNE